MSFFVINCYIISGPKIVSAVAEFEEQDRDAQLAARDVRIIFVSWKPPDLYIAP